MILSFPRVRLIVAVLGESAAHLPGSDFYDRIIRRIVIGCPAKRLPALDCVP
jgi:hypothetical protein